MDWTCTTWHLTARAEHVPARARHGTARARVALAVGMARLGPFFSKFKKKNPIIAIMGNFLYFFTHKSLGNKY